jgi:hypothetical protein
MILKHLVFSAIKSLLMGVLTFMTLRAWGNLNGADYGDLRRPEVIRMFIAASITFGFLRLFLASCLRIDEVIGRVRQAWKNRK